MVGPEVYDIAYKTLPFIRMNFTIQQPNLVNTEAEKNFKELKFKVMVGWNTLIQKTLIDPKLFKLNISLGNIQKERATEAFFRVFEDMTINNSRYCFRTTKFSFPKNSRYYWCKHSFSVVPARLRC